MARKRRLVYILLIVAVSVFVAGCAERERVMVPPRADLQGVRRIAVLDFDNFTADPGLALEAEQGITEVLRGYYQVIDRSVVEAALRDIGYRRGRPLTRDVIRDIGDILNVEAVVTGEITYYFEDVVQNVPYMTGTYENGTRARWAISQNTSVMVSTVARVTNTRTGVVMYSKRAEGHYSSNSTSTVNWTRLDPPPSSMLPNPNRRDIPQGRIRAVRDAVDSFTVDLLPTYVWRKVEQ